MTGRERALCPIFQVLREEFPSAQPSKDEVSTILGLQVAALTICLMRVVSEEVEDHSSKPRAMAKFETSRTGSGRDLFRHPQQARHRYVTEGARLAEASQVIQLYDGILLHGVRAQADRKMDLVPRDAISPRGKSWNARLQLQNLTTNGERTCAQMRPPSHLRQRRALLARQLLQLQRQHLLADPS